MTAPSAPRPPARDADAGRPSAAPSRLVVRRLDLRWLDDVLALQALAVAELPADQFAALGRADVERTFGPQGVVHGAFLGPRLVAYQSLLAYGDGADNLGRDLGATDLGSVVNLEETVVHPDARGRGLNDRLTQRSRRWAREAGFRTLATTISPFNVPSLKSHMRAGFALAVLVPKYGGAWRYVLAIALAG